MPLPGKFPVDAHECTCRYLAATQTCFQSEGEEDMVTSTEQEIRACSADSGEASHDDREDGRGRRRDSASSSKSCMSTSKSEN